MSVETINQKKVIVEKIAEKFKEANSAVVVEYRGLSVAEVTELRRSLRAENVEFKVYKNRLVQRATENTDYEAFKDQLTGPNAIAFGKEDAVAPARVLSKFAKTHEALVIKAAIIEGKVLSLDEVKEIATLPNREGMYSMLLGMLQAPVGKFARIVKAVSDAKPAEEAAPVEEAKPAEEAKPTEEPKAEEAKEEPVKEAAPVEEQPAEEAKEEVKEETKEEAAE